jgi:hypothetical protein
MENPGRTLRLRRPWSNELLLPGALRKALHQEPEDGAGHGVTMRAAKRSLRRSAAPASLPGVSLAIGANICGASHQISSVGFTPPISQFA